MLHIRRRHLPTCKQKKPNAKCMCPVWVDGMQDGRRIRYSLDTSNWEEASRRLLEITADKSARKESSVKDAVKDFISEKERQEIKSTKKYSEVLNPLVVYCDARAITTIRALDLQTIRVFLDSLGDSARTKGKKIERLRAFFRHCEELGWCDSNPALKLKKPKVTAPPVVPFTEEQQKAILAAIDNYPTKNSFGYDNRARMRAFVLVLRYTAMRMSDVTTLRRDKITNGRLLLRTTKTGATVHLPLPKVLLDALKKIDNGSPYYFWSGEGKVKSLISTWQIAFTALLKLAKVDGHPHMYRHTMAIELLEKGITVEQVAAILGNSPAIIYKHYAPWIASRQKALDAAIKRIWA